MERLLDPFQVWKSMLQLANTVSKLEMLPKDNFEIWITIFPRISIFQGLCCFRKYWNNWHPRTSTKLYIEKQILFLLKRILCRNTKKKFKNHKSSTCLRLSGICQHSFCRWCGKLSRFTWEWDTNQHKLIASTAMKKSLGAWGLLSPWRVNQIWWENFIEVNLLITLDPFPSRVPWFCFAWG